MRSGQKAEFFAALDGLGAAGCADLVEYTRTMRLDGVFRDEELGSDLAIAEAASDEGEYFKLPRGNAETLLAFGIWSEWFADGAFRRNRDRNFPHHNSF